jgi:hypothetical protein
VPVRGYLRGAHVTRCKRAGQRLFPLRLGFGARTGKAHSVSVLSPIPISVALGIAVVLVVVAVRGGANVPQEATKHILSRYHRHQGRGNEERKPDRTMVVGMPRDDGEQHGGQEQDEVAPVLGEVTDPLLKLPTLLCDHDEVVDVLCDDLLKCGSTGDLVSGIRSTRSSSDLMTARKSGVLPLPAIPPSRTPPASGAAPSANPSRPDMDQASFNHSISTVANVSGVSHLVEVVTRRPSEVDPV